MIVESDLRPSWIRALLPHAVGHNAVGMIPAAGTASRRLVLCAHIDTHRTPLLYSSDMWLRLFNVLVNSALASLLIGGTVYGLGALLDWESAHWLGLVTGAAQLLALALLLQAELTTYSPGANDNASGVGVALALAERLGRTPLKRTDVWLAFTGCEEASAQGMVAWVKAHGASLEEDAVYLILDQVGVGQLTWLSVDGLIVKHKTHPRALDLARRAAAELPQVVTRERSGVAYTDALVATQRGLAALTLSALPARGSATSAHWHQMSDTPSVVEPSSLADACLFAWQVMWEVDRS